MEQERKLSYEELNKAAMDMSVELHKVRTENQQLKQNLTQVVGALHEVNMHRAEIMLRIVEMHDKFPDKLVKNCTEGLANSLFPVNKAVSESKDNEELS